MKQEYVPLQRFLRRLAAVPELQMRVALWAECLEKRHPEETLAIVEFILERNRKGDQDAGAALLALSQLISLQPRLMERRLMPAAIVAQSENVLRLVGERAAARVAHETEIRPPHLNTDRDITLGERRAWARSHDRDRLSLLLLDPDPIVIRNLLANPRLLERDVLRIASAQPSTSEVLREVFKTARWSCRRYVQMALLQNPYTPLDIGRPLLELMDEPGLREVCAARSISAELRTYAKARLRGTGAANSDGVSILDDDWVDGLLTRRGSTESGGD